MEDWVKTTKAFQHSKTYKEGAKQAAKCMKGQHANEMAFAEAGSENVTPDMGDEKVETPDVVNGASNVTATFSHQRSSTKWPIPCWSNLQFISTR